MADLAERIYERHLLMTEWLIALGVSPDVAAEDACRIEHDISEETFRQLKAHIQKHQEHRGGIHLDGSLAKLQSL